MESRTEAQYLWHMDLVALEHVESSQTRDGTHVPQTGRWILIHFDTREVPYDYPLSFAVTWHISYYVCFSTRGLPARQNIRPMGLALLHVLFTILSHNKCSVRIKWIKRMSSALGRGGRQAGGDWRVGWDWE